VDCLASERAPETRTSCHKRFRKLHGEVESYRCLEEGVVRSAQCIKSDNLEVTDPANIRSGFHYKARNLIIDCMRSEK
jgi:hypothetical protein